MPKAGMDWKDIEVGDILGIAGSQRARVTKVVADNDHTVHMEFRNGKGTRYLPKHLFPVEYEYAVGDLVRYGGEYVLFYVVALSPGGSAPMTIRLEGTSCEQTTDPRWLVPVPEGPAGPSAQNCRQVSGNMGGLTKEKNLDGTDGTESLEGRQMKSESGAEG